MKKNYLKLLLLLIALISSSFIFAQTNRVKITVNWPTTAYENKVDVFDQANNLILTICNNNGPDDCYTDSGSSVFTATYDLGCLATTNSNFPDYSIKLFSFDNNAWGGSSSSVVVNVAGTDVITNNGNNASTSGDQINFSVGGAQCSFDDTDLDGVIDLIDIDDDNDGILDTAEGLDLNQFNCQVPSLIFLGGFYDNTVSSGAAEGTLGAVYRFQNASEEIDVLLQIVELTNCTIDDIDVDEQDTPEFLQSRLNFTGSGTPGVTYEFSLVNEGGDLDDLAEIQRIGGTTWDCDGDEDFQESVRYYNPSAYGLDNPTSLTQDDYADGAGITAGTVSYGGFSTNTILRSYFQFLANKFRIRMQLKKSTGQDRQRLYAMSFTQCDIFEYKAPTLTIVSGKDTDGDGINNELDIDADGDGIPDNVEAQSTLGYIQPSGEIDFISGLDSAYADILDIIDTDGDNIPDFLDPDSDNDGTPDIQENGMADTLLEDDTDEDGLNDAFEGIELNDPLDVNDDINDPENSVLPDIDGDVLTDGDLDYRDAVSFGAATIDFDGVDDYLDSAQILDGKTSATIMAWVKLNDLFNSDGFVIGQESFNLFVDSAGNLNVRVNGTSNSLLNSFDLNKWVHVAAVFENGNLIIYVNGQRQSTDPLQTGTGPLVSTNDKLTIGKNSLTDTEFFKGSIDEVRVFDVALNDDQLKQMVFQEIEENTSGNFVKGTVVPRDIRDFDNGTSIPWANLQAYYNMNVITGGQTFDASSYDRDATLYNINSVQEQTSPIPYETKSGGDWNNVGIWKNGDVWDITDPLIKDWAIFRINEDHDVYHGDNIKSYGLLIDNNAELKIGLEGQEFQDFQLQNGWYLELNGTIDLQDDSQLVQTVNSELVTGTDGKLLRRQEGNLNFYWYNYWSSPVAGNNINAEFKLQSIKDGGGLSGFTFTDAYEASSQISRAWLYKFQNGQTYYNWEQITELSDIESGIGYTQKGINSSTNPNDEQQYTFVGKPNNGTILVAAEDVSDAFELVNGGESVQDVTLTTTLVGNPYPSAMDAKKFISDNKPVTGNGVTNGTIYLWEQWSGSSHYLAEYEGGYGTINELDEVPAYQWNNPDLDVLDLVKTPSEYIPIAQGFFVEVIAESGNIEFNNSQRIFKKEAEADGPIFFRASNAENQTATSENNSMGIIRLELIVSNGNKREFVLGFGEQTTDGYDYGFDSRTIDPQDDDLTSYLNDEKMVIQSYSPIAEDKVVDLVFNSTGTYNYSLEIIEIKNISEDQPIFIKDNLTNTEFDLRTGAYNFTSDFSGEDTDRFDVVFKATTLDTDDFSIDNTLIFVNNNEHKLYVKGLYTQANKLSLTNMLGQSIRNYGNLSSQTLGNGLDVSSLSSGVYIVSLTNDSNQTIDKKVIIE